MSIGFSVSSIILYLFQPLIKFHETISPVLLWSIAAGIIWATAFVSFVKSIDLIGLSRSNQWKNLQGPVGVILSLFILGETATTNPVFAILAAMAIFLSAVFLPLHQIYLVHIQCLFVPEQGDHYGKANGRLCCSNCHDKEDKDLAVNRVHLP